MATDSPLPTTTSSNSTGDTAADMEAMVEDSETEAPRDSALLSEDSEGLEVSLPTSDPLTDYQLEEACDSVNAAARRDSSDSELSELEAAGLTGSTTEELETGSEERLVDRDSIIAEESLEAAGRAGELNVQSER